MEKEKDNRQAYLDVLITHIDYGFMKYVYCKPTFTGRYLNLNYLHPHRVIAQCLKDRAKNILSDSDTNHKEMTQQNTNLLNNYPQNHATYSN